MADAYLNLAEKVLAETRQPMRPREIILYAYQKDLLPHHLHGSRQDKTLHARLSEDIAADPERSRFFRTGKGVFFLEHFRMDETIALKSRAKYLSSPRRKELRRNSVLLAEFDYTSGLRSDGSTIPISRLLDVLNEGRYIYRPINFARQSSFSTVINSFVIVHKDEKVLSFRCGKYYPDTDPLYGMRTIGVGGAVFASDNDLLYDSMFGIIGNGINELRYGIGLPSRLAEDARYNDKIHPHVGVWARDAEISVIHVVLSYRCPENFYPSKAALSVNDLRWLDAKNPANSLSSFDQTSRILFEQDFVRDIIFQGDRE